MAPLYVKTRTEIQKVLTRAPRARAYMNPPHPWTYEQIPETISVNSHEKVNPRKHAALFVVHGMGTQRFADTAVSLRDGLEDTIDELLGENPDANIPPPYMAEGYWANYDEFKVHFEQEWKKDNEKERVFFEALWKSRTQSVIRTYFWFLKQLFRLVFDSSLPFGFTRRVGYGCMLPTAIILFTLLLIRYPRVLSQVLGDVRLYLEPRGFVEMAIVQRVDRRVGEQFLRLLGLNWDFEKLDEKDCLLVSGEPRAFSYITWVAHSLGSVVSYNVISDLLTRCDELRHNKKKAKHVAYVERALHRFITIGSPLEKIAVLFPHALRPWPEEVARKFLATDRRTWWTNFFHVLDPVSGILRSSIFSEKVENLHSRIPQIPLLAHTAYWKDVPILTYILSRTYGRSVVEADPQFRPPKKILWLKIISWIVSLAFFVGVIAVLLNPGIIADLLDRVPLKYLF